MRDDIAEGKGGYAGINIPADMKKAYLTELDAQINASKEQLEYYSSMSVPGGADPKMLLEKVLRHSHANTSSSISAMATTSPLSSRMQHTHISTTGT